MKRYEFEDREKLPCFNILYEQINILSILRKGSGNQTLTPILLESNCDYLDNVVNYFGIRQKKVRKIN
jgi:hypothetical protein